VESSLFSSPCPPSSAGQARHALAEGQCDGVRSGATPTAIAALGGGWESLFIVVVCTLVPSFKINVLGAFCYWVLGFLFVTVARA